MADSSVVLVAGIVVALIGGGLALVPIRMLLSRSRAEARGHRTLGTVVDTRIDIDMENSRVIYPIVEFVTTDGVARRLESVGSTQVEHPVGAQVTVYYDPLDPAKAGIVGDGRLFPIVFLALAASLLGFGVLLAVAGVLGFLSPS